MFFIIFLLKFRPLWVSWENSERKYPHYTHSRSTWIYKWMKAQQVFFPQSQCEHNITNSYQVQQVLIISDLREWSFQENTLVLDHESHYFYYYPKQYFGTGNVVLRKFGWAKIYNIFQGKWRSNNYRMIVKNFSIHSLTLSLFFPNHFTHQ